MLFKILPLGALGAVFGAVVPDIPSDMLEDFYRISQYAKAAICKANHNATSVGSAVYCDPGNCTMITQAQTEILYPFSGIMPGDTTGYIAVDKSAELIVLSFRGTVSAANRWIDFQISHSDASSLCYGCKAHNGFWNASSTAHGILLPQLESALASYPRYRLIVTGHSLGGALATLESLFLRQAGYQVDMYTFGALSVGNLALAEYTTDQGVGHNFRITHDADYIPKILYRLSRTFVGIIPEYSQSSPEYWITSGNKEDPPVTPADVQVIEGVNNESGNLGATRPQQEAHLWYLGTTKVCEDE
ncbi:alpha/beta-hydrolase [Aspergillus taichungensis]|uniref:feruloyl esterase n=1 Tax=Aspergillus taichungensis TaxID=482145 RepID=A0A2J5HYH6_9EURO|nr:alpha/beta-hydrolase [Aspergillus taichungensis]